MRRVLGGGALECAQTLHLEQFDRYAWVGGIARVDLPKVAVDDHRAEIDSRGIEVTDIHLSVAFFAMHPVHVLRHGANRDVGLGEGGVGEVELFELETMILRVQFEHCRGEDSLGRRHGHQVSVGVGVGRVMAVRADLRDPMGIAAIDHIRLTGAPDSGDT